MEVQAWLAASLPPKSLPEDVTPGEMQPPGFGEVAENLASVR